MITRRLMMSGATAAFAFPGATVRAQGKVIEIPVELTPQRVAIACMIGGKGPYRFVLDTGGIVSLIKLDLAKQLGLKQTGNQRLGMGGGTGFYPIYEARDVQLGGVVRQESIVLAGTDIISFGRDLAGSFAAGLLTGADSELDFDAKVLRIYPGGGPARDGWTRGVEAIAHKGLPNGSAYLYADVVLDGQTLRCGLDTGFPQPMRVTPATARRMGLEGRNWSPAPSRGRGTSRAVRAGLLEFGGARFERPVVTLETEGAFTSVFGDGLIGLPLIRQLNLATDVKANLLWTRRNAQPVPPPGYNMSGLWIDRAKIGVSVGAVGKGSPAEAAGLVAGDRIDGDFSALVDALLGPASSVVSLSVERGGQRRDVRLVLADYL